MNAVDRNTVMPMTGSTQFLQPLYINSALFAADSRVDIASELHMQRYERQLTLADCAKQLGVSPQQIEQVETGFAPQIDFYLALKMARLFGCKLKVSLEVERDFIDACAADCGGRFDGTEEDEESFGHAGEDGDSFNWAREDGESFDRAAGLGKTLDTAAAYRKSIESAATYGEYIDNALTAHKNQNGENADD